MDETDEIFEGYGQLFTSYPYSQRNSYTRAVQKSTVAVAVLENDFLRAVFLTEFGGRLWRLVDKTTGRDLLYTNDVIRPSNLSIRNAWFSGGVEWNIGMIGHSPYTTEPVFTARLTGPDGAPVLRFYAYERVRSVTYQMDFWLGAQDRFLNCRMRIDNTSSETIPMYWWSNIAVPEHKGGRIAVNAKEAYTYGKKCVCKVPLPQEDGLDVTKYNDIPESDDYFFKIPQEADKYIIHVDSAGYGLLQLSTKRLQGRKLFTWGHTDGSERWQKFLTQDSGPYIEIQAGLGKTQFGCIPMPAHTAWEWLEQYGPVQLTQEQTALPFAAFTAETSALVAREMTQRLPEQVLADTRAMAKCKGELVQMGESFGALENVCRAQAGERPLPPWLDFGSCDNVTRRWEKLAREGILDAPAPQTPPDAFMTGNFWFDRLRAAAKNTQEKNWYVWYQLGLLWFVRKDFERAEECFETSASIAASAWVHHALAVVRLHRNKPDEAARQALCGLALCKNDLSYCKEVFRILLLAKAYPDVLTAYSMLPQTLQADSRIQFGYITALQKTGEQEKAFSLLTANGGLELADIREGEADIGTLYCELCDQVKGGKTTVPHFFHFSTRD